MAKGGKKKKDSQAEKEAEEARRKEEEEKLKQEELQRKEREAQELIIKEKINTFFVKEKPRLTLQTEDFKHVWGKFKETLKVGLDKVADEKEWNRYLECSILPSPKLEADLNTYLMLWDQELLEFESPPSTSSITSKLPAAMKLMEAMESEMGEMIDLERLEKASALHSYMVRLLQIILKKWDQTTHQILQNVDLYPRESTENFQVEATDDKTFKFALWANLTKNPRYKTIEFQNSLTCSVARPLALDNVGIRMCYTYDSNCAAKFVMQKGAKKSVIGGVLYLDLIELPETPKKVETWTIRPILSKDGSIKRLDYPFKKTVEVVDGDQEVSDTATWATQVSYITGPNRLIDKSAKIMWWDSDAESWSADGILDEEVDYDTGRIKFKTMRFEPCALVQNTYLEFPYKDWHLDPSGPNEATLSITGKVNELKVLIKEGYCQVLGSYVEQHKSLQEWFGPSTLLKRLSHLGLNFIGPRSAGEIDGWNVKDIRAEAGCIEGISMLSTQAFIKKSASNHILAPSKTAFQFAISNHSAGQEHPPHEWRSIVYNTAYKHNEDVLDICFIPDTNNFDDNLRFPVNGSESKTVTPTVYHTLHGALNKVEGDEKIQGSPLFRKTVADILRITRVLAFS